MSVTTTEKVADENDEYLQSVPESVKDVTITDNLMF